MWPAERYGQVAKELAKDGICSLVNYGPGEEELAAEVEAASEGQRGESPVPFPS